MRLRLKLSILLGLVFLLSFAGLSIHDATTRVVGTIVDNDVRLHANLSITTLAISLRSQELSTLLSDLLGAIEADDTPTTLKLLGSIDSTQKERESLLQSISPVMVRNPAIASPLQRRKEIIGEERVLLDALVRDLSVARDKSERVQVMKAFISGEYMDLESERRSHAEEIASLSLEENTHNLDRVDDALERAANLYVATLFTLFISFVFFMFFINKRMIEPIEQITKTIEHISMGELEAEVPADIKDSADEIGRLAKAFDRTIMSLKMSMRGQKERAPEKRFHEK